MQVTILDAYYAVNHSSIVRRCKQLSMVAHHFPLAVRAIC